MAAAQGAPGDGAGASYVHVATDMDDTLAHVKWLSSLRCAADSGWREDRILAALLDFLRDSVRDVARHGPEHLHGFCQPEALADRVGLWARSELEPAQADALGGVLVLNGTLAIEGPAGGEGLGPYPVPVLVTAYGRAVATLAPPQIDEALIRRHEAVGDVQWTCPDAGQNQVWRRGGSTISTLSELHWVVVQLAPGLDELVAALGVLRAAMPESGGGDRLHVRVATHNSMPSLGAACIRAADPLQQGLLTRDMQLHPPSKPKRISASSVLAARANETDPRVAGGVAVVVDDNIKFWAEDIQARANLNVSNQDARHLVPRSTITVPVARARDVGGRLLVGGGMGGRMSADLLDVLRTTHPTSRYLAHATIAPSASRLDGHLRAFVKDLPGLLERVGGGLPSLLTVGYTEVAARARLGAAQLAQLDADQAAVRQAQARVRQALAALSAERAPAAAAASGGQDAAAAGAKASGRSAEEAAATDADGDSTPPDKRESKHRGPSQVPRASAEQASPGLPASRGGSDARPTMPPPAPRHPAGNAPLQPAGPVFAGSSGSSGGGGGGGGRPPSSHAAPPVHAAAGSASPPRQAGGAASAGSGGRSDGATGVGTPPRPAPGPGAHPLAHAECSTHSPRAELEFLMGLYRPLNAAGRKQLLEALWRWIGQLCNAGHALCVELGVQELARRRDIIAPGAAIVVQHRLLVLGPSSCAAASDATKQQLRGLQPQAGEAAGGDVADAQIYSLVDRRQLIVSPPQFPGFAAWSLPPPPLPPSQQQQQQQHYAGAAGAPAPLPYAVRLVCPFGLMTRDLTTARHYLLTRPIEPAGFEEEGGSHARRALCALPVAAVLAALATGLPKSQELLHGYRAATGEADVPGATTLQHCMRGL